MVFQNPDAGLNPAMKVRDIILEPAVLHNSYADEAEGEAALLELFNALELEQELLDRRPEQLSHGQKQRVAIARALITKPDLLFADEPVSALDPFVRAGILGLFRHKMEKKGMALVLISHDLEIVRLMSSTTVVMYKGRVVEAGPSEEVHERPSHPYTKKLMDAVLTIDPGIEQKRRARHSFQTGNKDGREPSGCPYYPECSLRKEECRVSEPPLIQTGPGRWVACIEARREGNRQGK